MSKRQGGNLPRVMPKCRPTGLNIRTAVPGPADRGARPARREPGRLGDSRPAAFGRVGPGRSPGDAVVVSGNHIL